MRSEQSSPHSWAVWCASLLLILLALPPLWLNLTAVYQANANEGWNAYHAAWVRSGHVLFPADTSYTISNYPPLSFWLNAMLSWVTGNFNTAGRVLNLVGLCLFCSAGGLILRDRYGRDWGLLTAATIFFFFCHVFSGYMGVNDPQMFGLGLGVLGLYCSTADGMAGWRTWLGPVLMVMGFGVKHNTMTLLLTVFIYLWLNDRKQAWTWSWRALLCGVLFLGLCHALYGMPFWENLFAKRGYALDSAKEVLKSFLGKCAVTLGLSAVSLLLWPEKLWKDYLGIGLVLCGAIGLAFSGGGGVATNVFYECTFFSLLFSVSLLAWARQRSDAVPGRVAATLFLLPLVLSLTSLPESVNLFKTWQDRREWNRQAGERIEYLRQRPGAAACENLLLCQQAGKEMEVDLYWLGESLKTGRVGEAQFAALVSSRHFQTIEIGLPPQVDGTRPFRHHRWPEGAVAALLENYHIAKQWPYSVMYVPKP